MGKRPAQRMPIEERAKQFMPFAALKGLNEALAAAERRAAGIDTAAAEVHGADDTWEERAASGLSDTDLTD